MHLSAVNFIVRCTAGHLGKQKSLQDPNSGYQHPTIRMECIFVFVFAKFFMFTPSIIFRWRWIKFLFKYTCLSYSFYNNLERLKPHFKPIWTSPMHQRWILIRTFHTRPVYFRLKISHDFSFIICLKSTVHLFRTLSLILKPNIRGWWNYSVNFLTVYPTTHFHKTPACLQEHIRRWQPL